jgi:hypothetical protein
MTSRERHKPGLETVCISLLLMAGLTAGSERADTPHLRKHGTATQLVVDGEPFLVLGGELGNSSASDLAKTGSDEPQYGPGAGLLGPDRA